MDLKAKGIRFRPSSKFLKDIRFESYYLHGQLQLPTCHITEDFKHKCSNMIAFEFSPGIYTDFGVTSYVNFMKSLIQSPDDVKELREKGIFTTTLSNKEVVQMFEEMDTYGLEKRDAFLEVKMRIEKHCSNKAKTWMAELLHTYFGALGPLLLCLQLSWLSVSLLFRATTQYVERINHRVKCNLHLCSVKNEPL
ncbi:UNVERIFIED_CONTAM: hypothetical protein Slati_0974800 [Sesamum latifolium]|uniref:Uncharacterized protein n=1 Tax=Sesamum latifolium TaxID=2727402 RepID=A0AAW2XVZ1_9LAMI